MIAVLLSRWRVTIIKEKMKAHRSIIRIGLLSIAAIAFSSSLVKATVAVSNLELPQGPGGWTITSDQYVGMSFTVGSDYSSWNLDSVDMVVFGSSTNDFFVELHEDDGTGKPFVDSILTFTGANPSSSSIATYNFIPSSPFTLSAGTTYWLTAESVGLYGWIYTNPSSGAESTALTDWSIGNNLAISTNVGASWSVDGSNPAKFAINATGIAPEPSSIALLALGGVAALCRRRV